MEDALRVSRLAADRVIPERRRKIKQRDNDDESCCTLKRRKNKG